MSAATSHSLPYDPATVEFDPLLRRLNLANTRWRQLLRARTDAWLVVPGVPRRTDHRGDLPSPIANRPASSARSDRLASRS